MNICCSSVNDICGVATKFCDYLKLVVAFKLNNLGNSGLITNKKQIFTSLWNIITPRRISKINHMWSSRIMWILTYLNPIFFRRFSNSNPYITNEKSSFWFNYSLSFSKSWYSSTLFFSVVIGTLPYLFSDINYLVVIMKLRLTTFPSFTWFGCQAPNSCRFSIWITAEVMSSISSFIFYYQTTIVLRSRLIPCLASFTTYCFRLASSIAITVCSAQCFITIWETNLVR